MDVDAIAAGIVRLATDDTPAREYIALGRKRALDFSWDRAARRTLEVYAAALAGTGNGKRETMSGKSGSFRGHLFPGTSFSVFRLPFSGSGAP